MTPPPAYSQYAYPPPREPLYQGGYPQADPYAFTARPTEPGPEWKKVGEKLFQKRDYLEWTNTILLIFDAMMLSGLILWLLILPIIGEIDLADEEALTDVFNAYFVLFTLIIQDGILIWMVWHQVVRRRVIPLSEMGLSKKQLSDSSDMARLTIAGVALGVVLFTIALAIELGQTALGFAPGDEGILGPMEGDLAGYLIWLISGCIIAPISEEFFFRGYAFYAFNKKYGLWIAVFVSALVFSAIHSNIYALLPIFVAGIGLALAFHKTGSLVPPMVAHAVNNFIALTLLYTGFYS